MNENVTTNTATPPPLVYRPPEGPLSYVHTDDQLLVLDKPSGLLTVPGKADHHKDCLESRVQADYPNARIVHRLDMDTSGLIVLALNPEAHRHLGLQFERRYVDKRYVADVWGQLDNETGEVDLPLICDWPNRPKQMVDFEQGKSAQTSWKVLARDENKTRVQLFPKTGRSHQLRVHMLSLGHPILGDNLYAHAEALNASPRLSLHAEMLEFHHPIGGERIKFESECPF
ncbi:MAG: RluA family pseudouridine synthase [Hyphomicrobiales bacterium]